MFDAFFFTGEKESIQRKSRRSGAAEANAQSPHGLELYLT